MEIGGEELFQARVVADGGPPLPNPCWVLMPCRPHAGDVLNLPNARYRVVRVEFDAGERTSAGAGQAQFTMRPVLYLEPA